MSKALIYAAQTEINNKQERYAGYSLHNDKENLHGKSFDLGRQI